MVNWKGALVLLGLVVMGAIYIFHTRPPAHPSSSAAGVFWGCVPADAEELSLSRPGGRSLLVRRGSGGSWEFAGPPAAPATAAAVDALLTQLRSLAPSDSLPTPAAGQDFGLANPYLQVTCRVAGGVSFNLSLGKQSFDGSSRYAQLAGDPKVYVLSGAEVGRLDMFLDQPPYRPSPIPSGPSPSPTT